MATNVVADLRNFTRSLNAAPNDELGVNEYCHFLSEIYGLCLGASLAALPRALRDRPPLSISSTGDGVLIVFTEPANHVLHGYLTALILHSRLDTSCSRYNAGLGDPFQPRTDFGIGVESGVVSRIEAYPEDHRDNPIVYSYIGECINVASRAEVVTKSLHKSRTIVAGRTNELLCQRLFGVSYNDYVSATTDAVLTDDRRLAKHDQMNELNRRLCLTFIHNHMLKGVTEPTPLFRLQESRARLGNPGFEELLLLLCEGSEAHLTDVHDAMT